MDNKIASPCHTGIRSLWPPGYGMKGLLSSGCTGPPLITGDGTRNENHSWPDEGSTVKLSGKENPDAPFNGLKGPPRIRGAGVPVAMVQNGIGGLFIRPPCQGNSEVREAVTWMTRKCRMNMPVFTGKGPPVVLCLSPPAVYYSGPPGIYPAYDYNSLILTCLKSRMGRLLPEK